MSRRVANAGMSAGLDKNYVAPGDKRVIAHTKVIGGGADDDRYVPDFGAEERRGLHVPLHVSPATARS